MINMPIIEAKGTPYEIGFAHGSQCRQQVMASLEYYKAAFAKKGIDWENIKPVIAKMYEANIAAFDADLIDEMKGIADGAGLSYSDILNINCRSEVLMMKEFSPDIIEEKDEPERGCTAFAVTPEMTSDKKMLHAQTWDFSTAQRAAMIAIKIRQSGGKPDILLITEGGLIGGKGVNSNGVSLTMNALRTSGKPFGVPLHAVMRGVLNSPTIAKAYQKSASANCASAGTITIGSKDGCALAVELVPGDVDAFYPIDGWIAHTNHVLSLRFNGISDLGKKSTASSHIRYGRCCSLLKGKSNITIEYIKDILADHVGYPNSICSHADPSLPIGSQSSTNYGVIFDLTDSVTYLCPGNPCERNYIEIRL